MTHVSGHSSTSPYSDSEYDFLFPSQDGDTPLPPTGAEDFLAAFLSKNLQPGRSATGNTITISETGDRITLILDDNGKVIDTVLNRGSDDVGPVTPLEPIALPRGWVLIPMTGGAKPVLLPPSTGGAPRFVEVPGSSKILAVEADGSFKVIDRDQAPVAAVEIGFEFQSDGTRRTFFADGTHRDTAPVSEFEQGRLEALRGDSRYVETGPGNFSLAPRDLEPGQVITLGPDGRQFIQQPDGSIQPLPAERTPSLDEMISKALLSGDIDGAIALSDFRDRPSSMELFQAALDFAQSPGDTAAISAIARGQTLVEPRPPGSVQRIAAQPEFLQDQFQKLMGRFRDGGGTPNDIVSALQDASNRMREDQDSRADAEQALADRDKADSEKQLQELLDRIDVLETSGAADLKGALGQTQAAQGQTQKLADLLQKEIQGQASTGSPVPVPQSSVIAPFISEENQQIIDQPSVLTPESRATLSPEVDASLLNTAQIDLINANQPTPAPFFDRDAITDEDDFFAGGGVFDDSTAIVGEEGKPELLIAQPGARVIPIDDDVLAKLKKRGVRGLQDGGFVPAPVGQSVNELIFAEAIRNTLPEDRPTDPFNVLRDPAVVATGLGPPATAEELSAAGLTAEPTQALGQPTSTLGAPSDANLPFGVRQALRGGSIESTRRRLSTAAGLPVLSAQARQRLLPEELDVLDRLRAEAGIPLGAFQQEQRSALPGARVSRASRFASRVTR